MRVFILAAALALVGCARQNPAHTAGENAQAVEIPIGVKVAQFGACTLWRVQDSVTGNYVYVVEATTAFQGFVPSCAIAVKN
jgi:hypothetical protein